MWQNVHAPTRPCRLRRVSNQGHQVLLQVLRARTDSARPPPPAQDRNHRKEALMSGRRGNSEGTIVQRSDGRYAGAIAWRDETGRSKRTWVYGRTRKDVRDKLKVMQGRL